MTTSEQVNELAAALAKAQGEMDGAKKDSANPFFKSKYPDLASVREACFPALSKHGIAVVQDPSAMGATVSVETTLLHSSGQWVRGVVSCTAKDDSPQSIGSATTYLRRYSLMAFAGVAPEDDDAETAQGRGKSNGAAKEIPKPPDGYPAWLAVFEAVALEGSEPLRQAWIKSAEPYRDYLTRYGGGTEPLKAKAALADAKAKKPIPAKVSA